MRGTRRWSSVKSVLAILCAACFLTTSLGSVSRAIAADTFQVAADDTFETWPKKQPTIPGAAPVPPVPPESGSAAAAAGDAAGTQTAKGMSAGTIGWIALGAAVVIGIAVAAGGGGGDSGSTTTH